MPQAQCSVFQVFNTISHFQILVNFFEQLHPVFNTCVGRFIYFMQFVVE